MSHDIVADALSKMMNAKRAKKNSVKIERYSKLLISVLALAKLKGHIKHYEINGRTLSVEFGKLNACGAIKPRYAVMAREIESYIMRYLPSKDIGMIIISTSKGLMAHQTAQDKNIGGSLLAYFY